MFKRMNMHGSRGGGAQSPISMENHTRLKAPLEKQKKQLRFQVSCCVDFWQLNEGVDLNPGDVI